MSAQRINRLMRWGWLLWHAAPLHDECPWDRVMRGSRYLRSLPHDDILWAMVGWRAADCGQWSSHVERGLVSDTACQFTVMHPGGRLALNR